MQIAVLNLLDDDHTGLPVERNTKEEVRAKANAVFAHVFRTCPAVPPPYYPVAA